MRRNVSREPAYPIPSLRRRKVRLVMERLEDRLLLAVAAYSQTGSTLAAALAPLIPTRTDAWKPGVGTSPKWGDSIAAQGNNVYNVSNYSDLPLNRPCYIRIVGVAPGASLVGLDIFGAEDAGFSSSFIQAIDYAVSVDHVNVLNESLGNNF